MSTALRQRMHQDLQLAGLADGTQKMYLRAVRQLVTHFRRPPDQLTESEVREYLLYLKNERQYSPSSLKIAASGIIFFYTHTVPRDWLTFKSLHIPRPQSLPDVLSMRVITIIDRPLIEIIDGWSSRGELRVPVASSPDLVSFSAA